MTYSEAKYIEYLRVDLGYTWRAVAVDFANFENQELGRQLCNEAQHIMCGDDNGWNPC